MNKMEVVTIVSKKSNVTIEECESILDVFEDNFKLVNAIYQKIKGDAFDFHYIATIISQKTQLDKSTCIKVLVTLEDVVGEECMRKLKLWKVKGETI